MTEPLWGACSYAAVCACITMFGDTEDHRKQHFALSIVNSSLEQGMNEISIVGCKRSSGATAVLGRQH